MIRSRDIDSGKFSFTPVQSLGVVLLYFVGYMVLMPFVGVFISRMFFGVENAIHPFVMGVLLGILLLMSVIVVRKPLKESFDHFVSNIGPNIVSVLKNFGFIFLFSIICNIIFALVLGDRTAVNQTQVEGGVTEFPILYGFMVMVFAPIVEELVFRGVFYQKFRSEKAYKSAIIVSTLIFGFLHVGLAILSSGDWSELVFIIQYAGLAYFMIKSFEETSSIWGAISVHFLNNAFGFIVILLSK